MDIIHKQRKTEERNFVRSQNIIFIVRVIKCNVAYALRCSKFSSVNE